MHSFFWALQINIGIVLKNPVSVGLYYYTAGEFKIYYHIFAGLFSMYSKIFKVTTTISEWEKNYIIVLWMVVE